MNTQEKLEKIKEMIDAMNSRDWGKWEGLFLDEATRMAPELAEPLVGKATIMESMQLLVTAFPDHRIEIRNAFGEGDWLCVEMTSSGTHSGPLNIAYQTFQPTFRPFESHYCSVFSFSQDKIASVWEYYDLLSIIGQLGIGR